MREIVLAGNEPGWICDKSFDGMHERRDIWIFIIKGTPGYQNKGIS